MKTHIPDKIALALHDISPVLELLPQEKWQFRVRPHPYPSEDLPLNETRETIIPVDVGTVTPPGKWVDAGSGRAFRASFPMTVFEIAHPTREPLADHCEWLLELLGEMNDQALGKRRLREWEKLLMVPLPDSEGQLNRLWCYGAYFSTKTAHIPLRPWAEAAACLR